MEERYGFDLDQLKTERTMELFRTMEKALDDMHLVYEKNLDRVLFIVRFAKDEEDLALKVAIRIDDDCGWISWFNYFQFPCSHRDRSVADVEQAIRCINRRNGFGTVTMDPDDLQCQLDYCWIYGSCIVDPETLGRIMARDVRTAQRFSQKLLAVSRGDLSPEDVFES